MGKRCREALGGGELEGGGGFPPGIREYESPQRAGSGIKQKIFTGIEKLVTLLIDKQGLYHTTQAGPTFDRQQDAEAYNQVLKGLNTTKEKVDAELRSKSHQ